MTTIEGERGQQPIEATTMNETTYKPNVITNKRDLFKRAWQLARKLADACEYANARAAFPEALTRAWQEYVRISSRQAADLGRPARRTVKQGDTEKRKTKELGFVSRPTSLDEKTENKELSVSEKVLNIYYSITNNEWRRVYLYEMFERGVTQEELMSVARAGKIILMKLDNPREITKKVLDNTIYVAGDPRHILYAA